MSHHFCVLLTHSPASQAPTCALFPPTLNPYTVQPPLWLAGVAGRIRIFNTETGTLNSDYFINLDSIITGGTSTSSEQGLLGLAFHPDYQNNGYFYVNYTRSSTTYITRYTRSQNPQTADASSARPGTFYVNTSELPTRRTYECEALALHEAIPGHHTQAAIQGEADLPAFRRYCEDRRYFEAPCRFPFYTGYIEGWVLHCETLGEELGLYKAPSDKMGQLSMEALRASRLVVDTGMHAFGWSLEKAKKYMLDNTVMGEHDALTEVIRYATWPGQACAYKVGERFIHRLKEKAKEALGGDFDARDFYDVVLLAGPVPLNTLEDLVNEYIAKNGLGDANASKKLNTEQEGGRKDAFIGSMTFANWCKCCVVPGTCNP